MRIVSLVLLLVALLAFTGCGGNKAEQAGTGETAATETTPPAGAPYQVPADLDQGPRAAETPVNEAMATQGEQVYTARGCQTCHAFGKRLIGPDLKGVASRRTERWLEAQILHPTEMTQQDPIAKQLLAEFKTQMTNQGLTPEETKQVIEYLKKAGK